MKKDDKGRQSLGPHDLQLQEEQLPTYLPPGSKKRRVMALSHVQLCRTLAQGGHGIASAAREVGMSLPAALEALQLPHVEEYLRQLMEPLLLSAGVQALHTQVSLLDSRSALVRHQAAKDLLDRAHPKGHQSARGGGDGKGVNITINLGETTGQGAKVIDGVGARTGTEAVTVEGQPDHNTH